MTRQTFEYMEAGKVKTIESWTPVPDDFVVIIVEDAQLLIDEHKITKDDLVKLVLPTQVDPVWMLTPAAYQRLAWEDRPCVWCGYLLEFSRSFNGKDICIDCAGGEG